MRYRLLGQTGLQVSGLALGTMTFGNKGCREVMGGLQQEQVNAQVKPTFDSGINPIGTANVYSPGEPERLLGQAIRTPGLPRDHRRKNRHPACRQYCGGGSKIIR